MDSTYKTNTIIRKIKSRELYKDLKGFTFVCIYTKRFYMLYYIRVQKALWDIYSSMFRNHKNETWRHSVLMRNKILEMWNIWLNIMASLCSFFLFFFFKFMVWSSEEQEKLQHRNWFTESLWKMCSGPPSLLLWS